MKIILWLVFILLGIWILSGCDTVETTTSEITYISINAGSVKYLDPFTGEWHTNGMFHSDVNKSYSTVPSGTHLEIRGTGGNPSAAGSHVKIIVNGSLVAEDHSHTGTSVSCSYYTK